MKISFLTLFLCIFLSSCSKDERGVVNEPLEPTEFTAVEQLPDTVEEKEQAESVEESVKESMKESKDLELSEYFHNLDGTAIFYVPNKMEYLYNEEKVDTLFSPYSTFKILSTLIGLSEGVISSEDSKMKYTGTTYWNDNWNHDLTLKESFQTSCVWFYHQMLYQLEQNVVEDHLNSNSYGNGDLTEWHGNGSNSITELNGFWLNSSLKISPRGQVYLLKEIFEGQSIYDNQQTFLLKKLMETEYPHIYAKTGAGNNQSWYVGFFEHGFDVIYFAVFLESDQKLPFSAKEVTVPIIENWDTLIEMSLVEENN